jgi:fluoroacetyl-CoA thioesterase
VCEVEAHDGVELITKGRHERFVIDKAMFAAKMKEKVAKIAR